VTEISWVQEEVYCVPLVIFFCVNQPKALVHSEAYHVVVTTDVVWTEWPGNTTYTPVIRNVLYPCCLCCSRHLPQSIVLLVLSFLFCQYFFWNAATRSVDVALSSQGLTQLFVCFLLARKRFFSSTPQQDVSLEVHKYSYRHHPFLQSAGLLNKWIKWLHKGSYWSMCMGRSAPAQLLFYSIILFYQNFANIRNCCHHLQGSILHKSVISIFTAMKK
jgi:hypothetical protein